MTFGRRLLTAGTGGGISVPEPGFNPAVNVDSSSVIDSGSGSDDWVGRASIVRRPSDDALVLAYYKAQAHFTNVGALHIRFSDDHGATWTAEDTKLGGGAVTGFPMNPPGSTQPPDAGEPQLYVCANGDLLIHMWKINYSDSLGGTYQARSTDGGETWDTPAGHLTFAGLNSDQHIRTFSTDDWFVHPDTDELYIGGRHYVDPDGVPSASLLCVSDDNGATWTRKATILSAGHSSGGGQETGIEYLGNDTIIAMIRDNPHTHSYKKVSTDNGATWGPLIDVTSTVGIAGRQRVYTRAHLKGEANWWEDPVLFMVGFVHQTSGQHHPRRVCIWISGNAGEDWSTPFYLDATTEDGGYGDMFYDPDEDQYVVVIYRGTRFAASLYQYRMTVTGI